VGDKVGESVNTVGAEDDDIDGTVVGNSEAVTLGELVDVGLIEGGEEVVGGEETVGGEVDGKLVGADVVGSIEGNSEEEIDGAIVSTTAFVGDTVGTSTKGVGGVGGGSSTGEGGEGEGGVGEGGVGAVGAGPVGAGGVGAGGAGASSSEDISTDLSSVFGSSSSTMCSSQAI